MVVFLLTPALAEDYRLTVGDRVIVSYDFLDNPKETQVDLDGNIRLSDVGSIFASGLTLDEVQEAIAAQISLRGFSGAFFVLVEVAEYSPIVVSGFVERSGQYKYLPGIDVSAALALAGGLGAGDVEGPRADVLMLGVRRRMEAAAESIVVAAVDIARLNAALTGEDAPVTLSAATRASLPTLVQNKVNDRLATEARQLSDARRTEALLVKSWNGDIADFEAQSELLDRRIKLKEEVIEQVQKDLADLDSLRTQGLTTAARFSAQQQRLADDREELLALETAKITARRSASFAARARDRYLSEKRTEQLAALESAQSSLTTAQRDYSFAIEELSALSGQTETIAAELPQLKVRYLLNGPRADRFGDDPIGLSSPLLPGDILFVEVGQP